MYRIFFILLILLTASGFPADQKAPPASVKFFGDTLAGKLPKTIEAAKGPYVVTTDILVPQGKTVIIEPGTVLLFRNFTGLKVQGTLLARGTTEKPIVFTSINDKQFNPTSQLDAAPYDWNGIYIYEDGVGSYFSYCAIYYSVYGINAMTKYIRIGPSIFSSNGRSNLTLEGAEQPVVENKPFEYSLSVKDATTEGVPLTILRDPNATKRGVIRFSGLGVCAAGLVMGAILTNQFSSSSKVFSDISSSSPENLAAGSTSAWERKRSAALWDRFLLLTGYTLGVAGGIGFAWSFTF
jgi:hypothetical protein